MKDGRPTVVSRVPNGDSYVILRRIVKNYVGYHERIEIRTSKRISM